MTDPAALSDTADSHRRWLGYALTTVVLWGIWGAFSGLSVRRGFPETLIYCVWAITMILPAVVVMGRAGWRLDTKPMAIFYGLAIGLLGAGGQMLLFYAVAVGPAYLIFPVVSLSPLVTIVMSMMFLGERTNRLGGLGAVLALLALPLFDYDPAGAVRGQGVGWFVLALLVMACWGVQAYFMKLANNRMRAESIFFYMTVAGLLLIPVALAMTDFSRPINWGWDGPRGAQCRRRPVARLRLSVRQGDYRRPAQQCRRTAGDGRPLAAAGGRDSGRAEGGRIGAGADRFGPAGAGALKARRLRNECGKP